MSEVNPFGDTTLEEEEIDKIMSEMENNTVDNIQPSNIVVDFILKICGEEKKAELEKKLSDLGVETLSDLEVLDLKESFNGFMKPVQIGKLTKELQNIATNAVSREKAGVDAIDVGQIFNHDQLMQLKNSLRLPHNEVINLTKIVGDHLFLNISKVSNALCNKVARQLLLKFPKALGGNKEAAVAENKLTSKIVHRVKYRKRLQRKKKGLSQAGRQPLLQLNKFSKRQCHGLDENLDLPTDFPPGENKESQEEKRVQMVKMHETATVNWKLAKKLMEETYVAQRLSINALDTMDKILKEWPFIGKFTILKSHFYKLMSLDVSVEDSWNDTVPRIVQFLTAEANKSKKDHAAEVTKSIRKVIKHYNKMDDKSEEMQFTCMILGLAAKLDLNLSSFFIHFSDTTSFDEVQASPKLPKSGKPCVAVLGDDLMARPNCFVLVDNQIISTETRGPFKSILAAFMAFFVFKITYPKPLYPLMNFLERDIFLIKTSAGTSRVERTRNSKGVWTGNPPSLAPKYVTLKEQIQDYEDMWQTEAD